MRLQNSLRRAALSLFVALALAGPAAARARVAAGQKDVKVSPARPQAAKGSSYGSLLERLKNGDRTVDFRKLRFAYTETEDYNPYGADRSKRRSMFMALNEKRFVRALEHAEAILSKNFVDLHAHYAAHAAHAGLGRAERAAFHRFVFDGLLKSITDSGDGKSIATAFVVISTDEEYALFNALGLRPVKQTLLEEKGHFYDQMTVIDPKQKDSAVNYYFQIDKPYNWLGQSIKK